MKLFIQIKRNKTALILFLIFFVFSTSTYCQKKYSIQYILAGKDTSTSQKQVELKNSFTSQEEAVIYINKIPELLLTIGYPVASLDSISYDSAFATVNIYLGPKYQWKNIHIDSMERDLLNRLRISPVKINFPLQQLPILREKILNYYEENGYPFAQVVTKNITISDDFLSGDLIINKGRSYVIDSITIHGTAKIKNKFIQNYLDIHNGSIYNVQKLKEISKNLKNLFYLQESSPWNLSML